MIVRNTSYNNNSMLTNLVNQQTKLFDAYSKIENNEKFSNISENPIDATGVININTQLQKIEMYNKNITSATTQINVQDSAFSTVVNKMQRIYELAVQAANGPSGKDGMEAAKNEIKQLKEHIVALANTEYNGVYIFGGANTSTPPYNLDADGNITYSGTPSNDPSFKRSLDIAEGVSINVNAAGDSVFGNYDAGDPTAVPPVPPSGTGLFKVLGDLEEALNLGDPSKVSAELDNIKGATENVSEIQSIYSASISKMTMTKTNHDDTTLILKSQKQNLNEIDQATAISEFIKQNYAYQASMQVFMQMQNQSLMNYM